MSYCFLHYSSTFNDLRQEHLARSKQVADDVHAVHQRTLDHFDRAGEGLPALFRVLDHVRVDALDQRVFQPFGNVPATPFLRRLFRHRICTPEPLGKGHQPLASARVAVQDDVFTRGAKFRIDLVVDI